MTESNISDRGGLESRYTVGACDVIIKWHPELAEKYEILKKIGTRYDVDGVKLYGKEILKNPEKYFTEKLMHDLNIACETEFKYGSGSPIEEEEEA